MTGLPKDKLASLRAEIDQQRNTIEALKRDGHECTDAERQLPQMLAEFRRERRPLSKCEASQLGPSFVCKDVKVSS